MNLLHELARKWMRAYVGIKNKNEVVFFFSDSFYKVKRSIHFNTLHMNAHQSSPTARITFSAVFVVYFFMEIDIFSVLRILKEIKQTLLSIIVYNSFHFIFRSSRTFKVRNQESASLYFCSVYYESATFWKMYIVISPHIHTARENMNTVSIKENVHFFLLCSLFLFRVRSFIKSFLSVDAFLIHSDSYFQYSMLIYTSSLSHTSQGFCFFSLHHSIQIQNTTPHTKKWTINTDHNLDILVHIF